MTRPGNRPPSAAAEPRLAASLAGAVDLSGLKKRAEARNDAAQGRGPGAPPANDGGAATSVDVDESSFEQEVLLRSMQVPVVVELHSAQARGSAELSQTLTALAEEYAGRFQHARVDTEASPQIAAAFQVQAVPTVVALVGGQPVPLFQGTYPADQLRQVLDEVLRLAAQNGVTGVIQDTRDAEEADEADEPAAEPEPAPLPRRHAEAQEALERDDLDGAIEAYRKAMTEDASDTEAPAALAQVELLKRTVDVDAQAVLAAAAHAGAEDVAAQLAAADAEVIAGQAEAAFTRLLATIRATADEDREAARQRLVSYFELVGATPEVNQARRALANALY